MRSFKSRNKNIFLKTHYVNKICKSLQLSLFILQIPIDHKAKSQITKSCIRGKKLNWPGGKLDKQEGKIKNNIFNNLQLPKK